jgi:hypothetical protein
MVSADTQLICAMMDYVLPMRTSAAHINTRKPQVLQSWHCYQCTLDIGNRQIHEDLGFSFFADHIRSLIEIQLKVSWCGELLSVRAQQIPR